MSWRYLYIICLLLVLISCRKTENYICLDEIEDKDELYEGFIINCFSFKNHEVDKVILNDIEYCAGDDLNLTESGYYHLDIYWENSGIMHSEALRIVILDDERGESEWGLKKWTPVEQVYSDPGEVEITFIHPKSLPGGMDLPIVLLIGDEINSSSLMLRASVGTQTFNIKRGIGSCQVSSSNQNNTEVSVGNIRYSPNIGMIEDDPILLNGTLTEDLHIPKNSYLNINKKLIIPEGLTLSIAAGTFISVDPDVDIINDGNLIISGSPAEPVTFTCSKSDKYWGGFIGTSATNAVNASYAIFCKSGIHNEGDYNYGHAHRQALFYCENGDLNIDHCYIIDHIGQIFYPLSATVTIMNSLVQRVKTGGQINTSDLTIENSVFTDFPDDSFIFQDEDNDALYLAGSNASINNTIFMYAKDDGLDSGASEGGEVKVTNSRFESIFHEGAALSSGGSASKQHTFISCTFTNCGQGLELGYSSPNHQVSVDSCYFIENGIGIRYGDNYTSPHHGNISVSNSISINNYSRDIWNMLRENWSADTLKMTFDNVKVSSFVSMYPSLEIYE